MEFSICFVVIFFWKLPLHTWSENIIWNISSHFREAFKKDNDETYGKFHILGGGSAGGHFPYVITKDFVVFIFESFPYFIYKNNFNVFMIPPPFHFPTCIQHQTNNKYENICNFLEICIFCNDLMKVCHL